MRRCFMEKQSPAAKVKIYKSRRKLLQFNHANDIMTLDFVEEESEMRIGKWQLKLQKPTKKQVLAFLRYALIVVVGNAITASAAAFFISPNQFVMGGTTGLGIFVRNMLEKAGKTGSLVDWAENITIYVANITLFIIGVCFLGKKFAAATLAGTLLYPSFKSLFKIINDACMAHDLYQNGGMPIAHEDPIVVVVMGSLIFGLGIGIVVRVGACTGGTDIPPLIFHKLFNLPVAVGMWTIDIIIVALQLLAVDITQVLIGIIISLLASFIINMVSMIGVKRAQVKIISKKYKEIREMILNKLNRGVTMLYGKTGFLQEKCFVLLTIISNRDVVKLKNEIQVIDPEAFLMVSVISEVRGRGFSSERVKLPHAADLEDLAEVTIDELTVQQEQNDIGKQ